MDFKVFRGLVIVEFIRYYTIIISGKDVKSLKCRIKEGLLSNNKFAKNYRRYGPGTGFPCLFAMAKEGWSTVFPGGN